VTLNELFRIWIRRWYFVAAFAAITACAVLIAIRAAPVYWTRAEVVFLQPSMPYNENVLTSAPESLIDFAALVERRYNGHDGLPRFSSSTATLYGSGVRDGSEVKLLDTGGQWASSFRNPVLVVEVVAPTEQKVRSVLHNVVTDINDIVRQEQVAARVSDAQFIRTLTAPETVVVNRTGGNRLRAASSTLLVGVAIGGTATVLLDRALESRKRRKLPAGS
jgi:hypothetical protein